VPKGKQGQKELIPVGSAPVFTLADPKADSARLVQAFLGGLNPNTLRAYRRSLEDFRVYLKAESVSEAIGKFLTKSGGEANAIVLSYKNRLIEAGKSAGTVTARLAAIRSLVKLARTLGVIQWSIEIKGPKSEVYRDTKGPGREAFDRVVADLEKKNDAPSRRDLAILRLLHDVALRRGEVVSLDIEHVDLENGTLSILGKGRHERETITLPEATKAALARWIEVAGRKTGPLFTNFDPAKKGGRLTGTSIYRLVRDTYGLIRPHGLRHTAITEALELTDGNVRAVQKFSRHKDVRVIERYDDNRKDIAGEIAKRIADRKANKF
jgi:integrase/recombinase XerC